MELPCICGFGIRGRACRLEVAEDGGGSGGNRDNTDRRVLKRFVVGEQGKISTFQEETEVSHSSRVSSQELMVEGGVTGLGGGQLLGEESQRSPGAIQELLQDGAIVRIGGINSQRDLSTRTRVNKLRHSG